MCREAKYSGVIMEVETFTMPIIDEIMQNGTVVG